MPEIIHYTDFKEFRFLQICIKCVSYEIIVMNTKIAIQNNLLPINF